MQGKIRKLLPLCVVPALLIIAGCAGSKVPTDYEIVSRNLDHGGTAISISNHSGEIRLAGKILQVLEQTLRMQAVADKQKVSGAVAVSALRFAVAISGVEECRWSGSSSLLINDNVEPVYRNKSFYLLPEKPRGIAWGLLGDTPKPFLESIKKMPHNTLFGGCFMLDLKDLSAVLEKSRITGGERDIIRRMLPGSDTGTLLKGVSGEWCFAVWPEKGFDAGKNMSSVGFMISMPDAGGMLFQQAAVLARSIPGCQAEKDQLVFNLPQSKVQPVLLYEKDRTVIFSSKRALTFFAEPDGFLESQPDFVRMSSGFPADGLAMFYSAGSKPETRMMPLGSDPSAVFDLAELDKGELSVVRKENDGILVVSHSELDTETEKLAYMALPLLFLYSYQDDISALFRSEKPESKAVPAKKNIRKTARPRLERQVVSCLKNLKTISKALETYQKKHGAAPTVSGIGGFRMLMKEKMIPGTALICPAMKFSAAVEDADLLDPGCCSYIYLGPWKKNNPKLPLVIDRPGLHPDHLHVLFNDGTVERFELKNCTSVKRAAGFLHTRFRYDEPEFKELIRKAAETDAMFDIK